MALALARTGAGVKVGRGGEENYVYGEAWATWVDDSYGRFVCEQCNAELGLMTDWES